MDRKTFIQKTAGVLLLAAPVYALLNCSSSDSGGGGTPMGGDPDCLANGTASSIGGNHGHSLTVSVADINAGVDKVYDIDGSSGHAHQVTITGAQFAQLSNNQAVSTTSTNGEAHTHSISVSCA